MVDEDVNPSAPDDPLKRYLNAGTIKILVPYLTSFMRNQPNPDFTVLILSGAYASSVSLTLDILAAAATMALRLGLAVPRWRIYIAGDTRAVLGNGLLIDAKSLPKSVRGDDSTWVVPGLGVVGSANIESRILQPDALLAIRALKAQPKAGGGIAASCSAVFLLHAADLLVGRRVTTSWWLAPTLKRMAPRCEVDADRMVVTDGNLVTAGAALAQTDLMLHLIRRKFGPTLADAVSRVLLIDGRQAQAPFIVPAFLSSGDDLIFALASRIEAALPHPPGVAELAIEFSMSERTLARRVRVATGRSTLDLVQSVRLGRARKLLESSRMTIDQIAQQVGYSDATSFRRMMRKFAGATPGKFRPSSYKEDISTA